MDPVANPYSPGAGKRPPALVGRDDEMAAFDVAVQRLALGRSDRSQMLTGLRGVGKTVLLHQFRDIAAGRGWVCQRLEVGEGSRFVHQIAAAIQGSLLDLTPSRALSQVASRALGVLKSFQLSWDIPEAGTLTVGVDPVGGRADSRILQRDLTDLLREVGTARTRPQEGGPPHHRRDPASTEAALETSRHRAARDQPDGSSPPGRRRRTAVDPGHAR